MALTDKIDRKKWISYVLILVGFILLYQYIFDPKIDLNGDNASYYILGKALHAGEGFVNTNSIFKTPNNHFPPGYPVLISWVMIFSTSFVAIKLVNGIFLLGTLLLSYSLLMKFTQNRLIVALTIIFLLTNSHLLRYSTIMMSEIPFLFLTLLSLTLFLKTYEPGKEKAHVYYILAFIVFMMAFYMRTLGIALLAAFLFMMLREFKTKWRYILGYILGFILFFSPWFIRSNKLGGNSYLKQLIMINPYRPESGVAGISDFITRILKNIERYTTREIPDVLFPFKSIVYPEPVETWEWIPGIFLIALLVIGIWKLPRFRWFAIIYFVSTFAILLLWPDVWVGVRFVLPLIPFLYMVMLVGLEWIMVWISRIMEIRKTIPLWPVLAILIFSIPEIKILRMKTRTDYEPKWNNYFNLARSFQREGVTDVVVSCRKPALFHLFSETFTTNYKYTPDHQDLIKDLVSRKADYVVLDQLGYSSTYRYLYPAIQNNPESFQLIAKLENPDTYLLKFVP